MMPGCTLYALSGVGLEKGDKSHGTPGKVFEFLRTDVRVFSLVLCSIERRLLLSSCCTYVTVLQNQFWTTLYLFQLGCYFGENKLIITQHFVRCHLIPGQSDYKVAEQCWNMLQPWMSVVNNYGRSETGAWSWGGGGLWMWRLVTWWGIVCLMVVRLRWNEWPLFMRRYAVCRIGTRL